MSDYEFDTDSFNFDDVLYEAELKTEILTDVDYSYIEDYKKELE